MTTCARNAAPTNPRRTFRRPRQNRPHRSRQVARPQQKTRQPLALQAQNAGLDLQRAIRRVERLFNDANNAQRKLAPELTESLLNTAITNCQLTIQHIEHPGEVFIDTVGADSLTAPATGYRPRCFSRYTAPRSGKRSAACVHGHAGAHTCAGITWSDTEADWRRAPAVVELPAEVRCASLHVGCCSWRLCTRARRNPATRVTTCPGSSPGPATRPSSDHACCRSGDARSAARQGG